MVVLWFSLYIFRCWFQVCSVPCGWYNETREIFGWSRSTASSTCLHRYSAVCGCLWSCKWLWFPYTWYIGIVDLTSVFVAQCRIMGERSPLYRAWILWMVTWVIALFLKNHSHLPWVSYFRTPFSERLDAGAAQRWDVLVTAPVPSMGLALPQDSSNHNFLTTLDTLWSTHSIYIYTYTILDHKCPLGKSWNSQTVNQRRRLSFHRITSQVSSQKKSFTLYVEMQLYIKVSFRFMLGTATGSSSESETIHIEGSAELDLVFYTVFCILLYFDGSFSFCQSQRWHHPSRAQRTCTCLQPHLVAPRMIICLKTVPSVVFFARAGFRSLRWSLSTLSGSCPSPNSKTQRNFLGLIQPVASGNWAPQLCKAISAADSTRTVLFGGKTRVGGQDGSMLGQVEYSKPGASTKAHSQFVHSCPLTQETISTLRKGGSVLIPADVAGWIPEAEP